MPVENSSGACLILTVRAAGTSCRASLASTSNSDGGGANLIFALYSPNLIRCEKAVQGIKPILGQHAFTTDNRNLTVIGFISWLIEHHEAILLLTMHDMPGSASALLRPVVEGSYRALWINLPATDDEVKAFNDKDKIDLKDLVTSP